LKVVLLLTCLLIVSARLLSNCERGRKVSLSLRRRPPPYQHQKGEREREGRTDLAEDAHGELGGDLACLDEVVERVGQGESDAGGRRLVSV
jgi:hypothetical protein